MRNIIIKFTGIIFLLMHFIYIFPVELNFKFYKTEEVFPQIPSMRHKTLRLYVVWNRKWFDRFDGYSFTIINILPRNPIH